MLALNSFRYTYYSIRDMINGTLLKHPWNNSEYINCNLTIFPRYIGTDKKSMIFQFINFTNPVKFSKDNIFSFPMSICFRNNDVLFITFKTQIRRLIEAGITSTFEDQTISYEKNYRDMFKVLDKGKDFAPLSLEMLDAGFIIWTVSLLLALLSFICENIFYGCPILMKKLKDESKIIKNKFKKRKQRKKFEQSLEGIAFKMRKKLDKKRAKRKIIMKKNLFRKIIKQKNKLNIILVKCVKPINEKV